MKSLTTADGTRIAFERCGSGPPLMLVHGTADDHSLWSHLLPALGGQCTVYAIDRRGRGASSLPNGTPYAMEQEFEDVATLVDALGEPAYLLGHSYGALCALEAALRTGNLRALVLYEPPLLIPPGDGSNICPPETLTQLDLLLAADDREGIMLTFAREIAHLPEEQINAFRAMPEWQASVAAAPTIVREVRGVEGYVFEPARFAALTPPTLLLTGSESPPYLRAATEAVAAALPNGRLVELPGQGHLAMYTNPELFIGEVASFLASM